MTLRIEKLVSLTKVRSHFQGFSMSLRLENQRDETRWQTTFDCTSNADWDTMVRQVQAEIDVGQTEPLGNLTVTQPA